jgi:uncharacterized membrane protein HdeD (DUF308 family)
MRRGLLLVFSLLLAGVATLVLARLWQTPGRHWFDSILWVGYLAGSAVSGNIHSPNEVVAWLTIFLGLAVLAYGAALLICALATRRSKNPPSTAV